MGFEERRKGKFEAAEKFVEKMKKNPGKGKSSIRESTRGDEEVYKQKVRRRGEV